METAKLSSTVASLPTARSGKPRSHDLPASAAEPTPDRRTAFHGQYWAYRNGFDRVLRQIPLAVWQNPEAQGWERIKQNARRQVWRARIAGTTYYLKYYVGHDWRTRLKALFRAPACQSEWRGGLYALRMGIAAVAPAGYTTHLRRNGQTLSLLVTEAAEPAYPLNEFWRQVRSDDDTARRRRDVAQLAELLGETIARAHQAGFEHLDMHAANILVQPVAPGRYRTLFVDLHSARLGVPISDRAVVRNLAQLNQWFRRHSTLPDRLRFLRAYFRARNEYEQAFSFGRPLGLTFRALVRALAHAARRHAARLGAQRDRRTHRNGQYFSRVRLPGGWRGMVVRRTKHASPESRASGLVFERTWWSQQLARPLHWFADQPDTICKDSHSAAVGHARLAHPGEPLPVIVKRPRGRNWRRRLSQLLGPSRSRRGWRVGHALLHRHVPAARPLAVLERRVGPLVLDSLLITEAIPGGLDLETFLHRAQAEQSPAQWRRCKRALSELLARHVRRLDDCGCAHRDCKASNILIVTDPEPRLLWIDMDGLRLVRGPVSRGRKLRALVALHVSLGAVPGLTRADRLRFLKSYTARWGSRDDEWRVLWRELAPRVSRKIRAKQARRGWKLRNYGRP